MENKKGNVSTVILVIAIILIGVMGYMMYQMNFEIKQLSEKITAKDTVADTNNETENSSDIKYSEITKEFGEDERFLVTEAINNNDGTYTLKGVVYEKFTLTKSELEDAVKNGGYKYRNVYGTDPEQVNYKVKKNYEGYDYVFIGKFNNEDRECFYASRKDNNTYYIENGTEYFDEWKLTDEYKQIIVSNDTECEYSLDSNYFITDTVKNVFSKELYFGGYFNFAFENEKCTYVYEMIIGH